MAIIVSSIQDGSGYHKNKASLEDGLQNGYIEFQDDNVNSYEPDQFVFDNKRCVYDFTRSAKSTIRDDMADYLCDALPGLSKQDIKEVFDCLFNYHTYKDYLENINDKRYESMKMLVFNEGHEYVAHACFNSTSRKTAEKEFTVDAALTCESFTYFKPATNLQSCLEGIGTLHLSDTDDSD
ncbi:hypothetical protein OS493_034442 [Desmophyllum pertusum]|uniref:Uncharacterized protein n=1 Tax=Desmophyllum pertusum TaxID=174260 RepID=A0A9X0CUV5_9CNID|nr:hypothetical protein OS493_034442 [Desmophyllum pertusum]